MQIYFSESKMSINNYKQLPRSKDTGKAITGMAAKASGSRGRGNPSKPNVSAAGSQATGVSNSGNQQVKNFSSNSILPYIIKTKRTPLNNVKVSNLNNKPLLSESTINCAQSGSNASDSNSPNSWKNSTNSHAQKVVLIMSLSNVLPLNQLFVILILMQIYKTVPFMVKVSLIVNLRIILIMNL